VQVNQHKSSIFSVWVVLRDVQNSGTEQSLQHEGRERHNEEYKYIPCRSSVRQFLPHKLKRVSGILTIPIHTGQQVLRNNVDILDYWVFGLCPSSGILQNRRTQRFGK
jgi:hypothetical protein